MDMKDLLLLGRNRNEEEDNYTANVFVGNMFKADTLQIHLKHT